MAHDRRAWLTSHAGSANYAARDRLNGAGLPASLPDDAYARIASRMAPPPQRRAQRRTARAAAPAPDLNRRRYASIEAIGNDVGFTRIAAGMYRDAHTVWELRPGDGDEVYLVRQHEERLVDLRGVAGLGTQAAVDSGIVRSAARDPDDPEADSEFDDDLGDDPDYEIDE